MKITASVLFLFLIAGQAYAQINPHRLEYLEKVEKYRRMRNTGTTLTALGSVLVVVGIVTLVNSSSETYSNGTGTQTTNSNGNLGAGLAAYLVGAGCLGAGIPLWIVGGIQHGRYERKVQQLDVGFNLNQKNAGLTLTYRF